MSPNATTGVLLMAYGTPDSLQDVEAYYTHIRGGRPPGDELLEGLRERYRAVGGRTPLSEISEATRAALETRLSRDGHFRVVLGMKHWRPWIKDAVAVLAGEDIHAAIGLVLAPHYSSMSIAAYYRAVAMAQQELGASIAIDQIESWHLHPPYLRSVARRVAEKLAEFPDSSRVTVVFTAHSLPQKIVQSGDPYPEQLRETSEALAADLGLKHWRFSYQSAGRTEDPWLGPDILDTLQLLADSGVRDVLAAPIGFVSDHLEIFYDIDREAAELAGKRKVRLLRTDSLNASPDFIEALADLVLARSTGA
ncbi:MAG: ferrochelatase [Chloroflexota bacterium]